jgi:arginase
VSAPSALGLQADGVAGLPDALLGAGLAERLEARDAGRVPAPARESAIDPGIGVRNAAAIAEYTAQLGRALRPVIERGEFPVVLGGDCTILLGSLMSLRGRGRHGLLFIDGHADFYSPQTDPQAEAASMELAFATGRGPAILANIDGAGPLVQSRDVALFGYRDGAEQAEQGAPPTPPDLRSWDLAAVREQGAAAAARAAASHVSRAGLEGFWIHVDADVLDDAVMPAVDYRLPGGLSVAELVTVLDTAMATGRANGLDVTIYNPELDPNGSAGLELTRAIGEGLANPGP